MWILAAYAAIVVAGASGVVGVGLVLDQIYPTFSLIISISLFFAVFWFGWTLAVYLTKNTFAAR
jgi:hypothetical protein